MHIKVAIPPSVLVKEDGTVIRLTKEQAEELEKLGKYDVPIIVFDKESKNGKAD
jgi:hypothetical protein